MTKKIAIINDISGFGRCSISVIQPIVSHLGIQGCPLPTAIFSNHTGFPSFFRDDYSSKMPLYINEWRKLQLDFDGIMTGFLGSARQIGIVSEFLQEFGPKASQILIDPVMGDNGHIYPTYTTRLCREMKNLIHFADIITPNITEACFLTDTPYKLEGWHNNELETLAHKLLDMGTKQLVITGVKMGHFIGNVICHTDGTLQIVRQQMVEHARSGTGDVFSAVLGADAVNGVPFAQSVKRASNFVKQCLIETDKYDTPMTNGIDFEPVLEKLKKK